MFSGNKVFVLSVSPGKILSLGLFGGSAGVVSLGKRRELEMDKLQWGSRKRLRCVKVKDSAMADEKSEKKITSRVDRRVVAADNTEKHQSANPLPPPPVQSPLRLCRDLGMNRSSANENRKMATSSSPEKEDRYYTTRGSIGLDENAKLFTESKDENKGRVVWPKLFVSLSSKEKEEDFMAMKGCKLPQRPKKRAKIVQKTLLLVSPGTWLNDLSQERYEVREKKASKKRPRGLKAMGSMDSGDSE
ncbi:uncharacterized protein LOC127796534 [Diospyros lotus]|uniref:uncharacterized protein LOC127796534 n=1 Tax=Diospyros lotus TaxID=55363 RepID=UPI002255E386|nr:uncharacterized protein LOC127796534 [Diospyros lotus]